MPVTAGSKLGPYEILDRIGSGGMGEVYLGYDPRLQRRVAIKLLPANLSADPGARVRLERSALRCRARPPFHL